MTITSDTEVITLTAPTNLPIKLTAANFPVWRKQVETTFTGFDLLGYITGTLRPPPKFTDEANKVPNPCYFTWYRQDQILISAILGSCTESVQPLLSSANTAQEAWDILASSYASASPGRILALKSKLSKNPRGTRSIAEYMKDMQQIASDLALAKSPVSDADLLISIVNQLGDSYQSIVSALRVRNTPTTMLELSGILEDHERLLHSSEEAAHSLLATAHATVRQPSYVPAPASPRDSQVNGRGHGAYSRSSSRGGSSSSRSHGRQGPICRFCQIPGHVVRECRKLARFLRDNHYTTSSAPAIHNTVTASPTSTPGSSPWMFDSGVSHHATSHVSSLHDFSAYDGPDEIRLGNGSAHGDSSHAG
ncbi:unnamed protein product [Cuscuta epithymum]|uniref:Retrotransposon Copia-like N-terminal domain-containing protein n=1 Tax=Cuscuta epithymum TaxID=186058 RepID=A0AAV0EGZ6_9ASTE|nr:unnamed protein product [Cuscuta epithymum]